MTTPTLQELRIKGYEGWKLGSYTPGTDPKATDEKIAAEIIKAIDAILDGDFEEMEFD